MFEPFESLSVQERSAVKKAVFFDLPRPEYASGKIVLQFEHRFPVGEVLEASQDEEGLARIILKRGDEVLVNFKDFAEGGRLVTPKYMIRLTMNEQAEASYFGQPGRWRANPTEGFLQVGDMKDPRSVFTLLHELGHMHQKKEFKKAKKVVGVIGSERLTPNNAKRFAELMSALERGGWAWALRAARKIREQHKVDLFELFRDGRAFREFVYGPLASHKIDAEMFLKLSKRGFAPMSVAAAISECARIALEEKDFELLEQLFDKGRLRRAPTEKKEEEL